MAEETVRKQRMLSGIQPTGTFTLGNYIGAVKHWGRMQEDYECAYFIADLHSLTVRMDASARKAQSMEAYMLLLSCGLDPEKTLVFMQSHVPAHAEMGWILSCYTQFGELSRMTQFKDKSQTHADNINAGLFTYPSLMAGDILLYQADFVPVGEDQRQHLELTRDIATRFNNLYGEVFRVPEPYIPQVGGRVMSLQDPTKKMSKSDENVNSYILMLDDPKVIVNKFKRAVTDSEKEIIFKEGKDGINNLMVIYSAVTGKTLDQIRDEFEGKGYGDFKLAVGEAVAETFRPVREKYADLQKNKDYVAQMMKQGAETAHKVSQRTLSRVRKKLGLLS
ncbi:MAG: tryptophan--tRNA ligase [Lachnospiraceae bacterium]|nr:tryptophan--tRNA ligase [Lachnospiraceae bacterium]